MYSAAMVLLETPICGVMFSQDLWLRISAEGLQLSLILVLSICHLMLATCQLEPEILFALCLSVSHEEAVATLKF